MLGVINDNSFITKKEYGKMLYNNPRGISCKECHGNNAKGKIISQFKHKKSDKFYNCVVKTYDITNISKEDFNYRLNPKNRLKKIKFEDNQVCKKLIYGHIMPKYFLTNEELDSLYFYIKNASNE
jgi:hypothetical protein